MLQLFRGQTATTICGHQWKLHSQTSDSAFFILPACVKLWLVLSNTFSCSTPASSFFFLIDSNSLLCFHRSTTAECVMGVCIHARELSVCSSQMKRRSTSLDIRSTKEAAGVCLCVCVCSWDQKNKLSHSPSHSHPPWNLNRALLEWNCFLGHSLDALVFEMSG